jgi:hypothetical protein
MYDNTKGRNATASLELASTAKTRFEEFLRRNLGVSDATDPTAVVGALRRLYPAAAARLEEEKQGVTVRFNAVPETPVVTEGAGVTAGALKAREVREALEADLEGVISHAANRDYRAALTGWRDAILAELREGEGAAYLAADPSMRDRAFYSVRKLGDYARVSRLVSLLNPGVMPEFRRLAASLDEASVVLRVQAGEALFRAGFDEGGSVFQVALTDLRQRRETLIRALEELSATRREGGDEDWGDGEASYGALLEELGRRGHQDLRALLRPEAMVRLLDVLLDTQAAQQPDYLRGIASTVPVELVQLKRLRVVAADVLEGMDDTEETAPAASAPLSAFVQALNLFISAFAEPGTGARLLYLALPSPFASLQLARADEGGNVVRTLFHRRAELANELDTAFADPDFDPLDWPLLIKLDRVLYDVDRAIDLYLMGGGNNLDGDEELRAKLYARVLEMWLDGTTGNDWSEELQVPESLSQVDERKKDLRQLFKALIEEVVSELNRPEQELSEGELERFLLEQQALERQWKELAVQLTQVATGRRALLDISAELYGGAPERDARRFEDRMPRVPPPLRITNRLSETRLRPLAELKDLLGQPVRRVPDIQDRVENKLPKRIDTVEEDADRKVKVVDAKVGSVAGDVGAVDARVRKLEEAVQQLPDILERFMAQVNSKLDEQNKTLQGLQKSVTDVSARVAKLEKKHPPKGGPRGRGPRKTPAQPSARESPDSAAHKH